MSIWSTVWPSTLWLQDDFSSGFSSFFQVGLDRGIGKKLNSKGLKRIYF